ncbi:MAG: M20/M25/M40 family metallo-hydrolase, partial [Bacteroidota bacterium]
MIKKISFYLLLSLGCFSASGQAGINDGLKAINESVVEAQLEFLSSDWTEGRATGTRGAYMAGDYIASMFKLYGLEPGGDMVSKNYSRREISAGKKNKTYRSYYQNFPLIEYSLEESQDLSLIVSTKNSTSTVNFSYKTDFSVYSGAISREGSGNIVFVGYGLENEEQSYNELSKNNLEGKIILRLSGYPGHSDPGSASHKFFKPKDRREEYMMMRRRNELAAEHGVTAILEVDINGNAYNSWAENIPFRFNTSMYEGDVRPETYYDTRMTFPGDSLNLQPPVFVISYRMANQILEGSGVSIKKFEEEVARDAEPQSKELKDKKITFKTRVNSKIINARNVIGVLKGKDTSNIIVVGGHYDHIGKYSGYIWNGADDNASGTVGVMSIAKACLETGEKPERTIVFAAWTGEEKGLWGSKYFAGHPYNNSNIILNLNYDMISRDNDDDEKGNKCRMTYTQAFPELEKISRENVKNFEIDLDITYRPSSSARGGSDHAPFAQKDIPYFYFMAGFPPEYHQPDDHI